MQIYKEWLRSHNIQFNEFPFGIGFQYQGGSFIISDNSNDRLYFQLIMPNIYEVSAYEKTKAMGVINNLNREVKCLKVTMQEDGRIWLATETFIDNTPNLEDFFDRLLQILLASRIRFQIMMQ